MSIVYCEYCHDYIDTDFNLEHFDEDDQCLQEIEDDIERKTKIKYVPLNLPVKMLGVDLIIDPKTMKEIKD